MAVCETEQAPRPNDRTFGALLRQYRRQAGLTQDELAARAELTTEAISFLERGKRRRPYPHTVAHLAAALDLSLAERAVLLAAAREERSAPADSSADAHAWLPARAALPTAATPLMGRTAECDTLSELLRRNDARLVTVVGPGGVGKTHLCLHVAALLRGHWADGVAFVRLAAIRDAHGVAPAITAALGLTEAPEQEPLASLITALQRRRLLLVLDNYEQVSTTAVVAADLVAACPRLTIVVTSRTPLQLVGEHQVRLAPFPILDEALCADPVQCATNAGVQLFVARARQIDGTFALTADNAATIAQICRRVDGLPLAIELAAARSAVLPPAQLLARLVDRLDVLAGGAPDRPVRQRALRDTITWSYELLSPHAQPLFRRLAVCASGAPLELVEALADDAHTALDLLGELVAHSLVMREQGRDAPRYTMLNTVRIYALECLTCSGDEERARAIHARFYVASAEDAPAACRPHAAWSDGMVHAHDDLQSTLSWLHAHQNTELGLHLAAALSTFWREHGHLVTGRRWLEAFLALPLPAGMDAEIRASAHAALARIAEGQGDATTALLHAHLALRATGRDERRAEILLICALAERHTATYSAAEEHCVAALGIFRQVGHARGMAMALKQLGILCMERAEWARAIALFEDSLSHSTASNDPALRAKTLTSLGVAYAGQGLNDRAMAYHMESMRISRQYADMPALADILLNIGHVAAMQHDYARALAAWEESAELFRTLGDTCGLGMAVLNRAEALVRSGIDGPAAALCLEGLTLAAESNRVRSVIGGLEIAAVVIGDTEGRMASVRLLGVAAALRASFGLMVVETEHEFIASYLTEARRVLGEETYAAAWQHGQRWPVGDALVAVQMALRDVAGVRTTLSGLVGLSEPPSP